MWVLQHLWKEGDVNNIKVKLLDTLLYDPYTANYARWIFTHSSGYILKKKQEKCTSKRAVKRFLPDENYCCHVVSQNEFFLVTHENA